MATSLTEAAICYIYSFSCCNNISPMVSLKAVGATMYTIKGFLNDDGSASVLASSKDSNEACEKAAKFRKLGRVVEIWLMNGVKVPEPEIDINPENPQCSKD